MHIVLSYIKISNSVGRNDNFLAKARKLSILPTSSDIFDILCTHSLYRWVSATLSYTKYRHLG